MKRKTIHCLSGVAMMISGLLLGLSYLVHPHDMLPAVIASTSWLFIHVGFFISLVLGLLGTTGFYSSRFAQTGVLGLLGFVSLFVGMVMIAGLDYYEFLIAPYLAIEFPIIIERYGAGEAMGPVAVAFPLSGAMTVIGFACLAAANLRGNSFNRRPMIALLLTSVFFGVGLSPLGGIVLAQGGAFLFGGALIWTGWCYWKDTMVGEKME